MRSSCAAALLPAALALALVAGLTFAAGLPSARAEQPRAFDHVLHVTNNERACNHCHAAEGPTSPQVDRKACAECHDKVPTYRASATPRLGIPFPHASHSAA